MVFENQFNVVRLWSARKFHVDAVDVEHLLDDVEYGFKVGALAGLAGGDGSGMCYRGLVNGNDPELDGEDQYNEQNRDHQNQFQGGRSPPASYLSSTAHKLSPRRNGTCNRLFAST